MTASDSPGSDFIEDVITLPLDSAAVRGAFQLAAAASPEVSGDVIGCYHLVELLGRGGFGAVWLAEQQEPVKRQVALKIINREGSGEDLVSRFMLERQALALMDHPNIAKVYDAGTTPSGRPFFVMELVRGAPITAFCDEHGLTIRQRLELFINVCHAVQHAHQKGVIHRDLKPSNILVAEHDGQPVAKIIDFGIAKAADKAGFPEMMVETVAGVFLGTPVYMSPEQAAMTGDIDTRSDIYALGVLLYELLTGSLPFDGRTLQAAGFEGMRRMIQELEPPLPSRRLASLNQAEVSTVVEHRSSGLRRLTGEVRGDLDWIVMQCLEKDRDRRYESASSLAQDISHFLSQEPVSAAAPSAVYRVRKFLRRNRGVVAATAAMVLLLILGIVASSWQAYRATIAESEVLAREKRIADFLLDSGLQLRVRGGDARKAMFAFYHVMERAEPQSETWRRGLWHLGRAAHEIGEVFVHDRPVLAAVSMDGTARDIFTMTEGPVFAKWEVASRKPLPIVKVAANQPRKGPPTTVAGEHVTAFHEKTGRCATIGKIISTVSLRQTDTGALIAALNHEPLLMAVVMTEGGHAETIEGAESVVTKKLEGRKVVGQVHRREAAVNRVEFSPDGSRVMTHVLSEPVRVWDAVSGRLIGETMAIRTTSFQCSPAGGFFATLHGDATMRFWDMDTAKPAGGSVSLPEEFGAMLFSPDGTKIGTIAKSGAAQLLDVQTRTLIGRPFEHTPYHKVIEFSPDSRILYLGTDRNTISAWNTDTLVMTGETSSQGGPIFSMHLIPKERAIMTAGNDHTARLLPDPRPDGDPMFKHGKEVGTIEFSADGSGMVTSSEDGLLRVWTLRPSQGKVELRRKIKHAEFGTLLCAAISPDGNRLASGNAFGEVQIWNARTGREIGEPIKHRGLVRSLAFSPDGSLLLSGGFDGVAVLSHAETGVPVGVKVDHGVNIAAVGFSPDGKLFATAGGTSSKVGGRSVRIWRVDSGEEVLLKSHIHHEAIVWEVKFSPDGTRIVTGSSDGTARLWDAGTGSPVGKIMHHDSEVTDVDFGPSGDFLLTACKDGRARLWDTLTCELAGQPVPHAEALSEAAFVPGGKVIVTADEEGGMRFSRFRVPVPETDLAKLMLWIEVRTGLREDERGQLQMLPQLEWQRKVTELGHLP